MASPKEVATKIVARIMSERAWSASRLAREIGVAPSTITRILDQTNPFTPSSRTLHKLAELAGREADHAMDRMWLNDANLADTRSNLAHSYGHALPVIDSIESGTLRDAFVAPPFKSVVSGPVNPAWESLGATAYEIADDRSDPLYKKGMTIVVCSSQKVTKYEEDIFLFRREIDLWGTSKYELSLWEYKMVDGKKQLVPRAIGTNSDGIEGADETAGARRFKFRELGVVIAAYQSREDRIGRPTIAETPFD